MNIKKIAIGAMSVAGLLVTMVAAHAQATTLLAPGTTVVPGTATESQFAIASQTLNFSKLKFTGSLVESVYRETNGFLTFSYQLINNAGSKNTLKHLTLIDFTGFTTFVGKSGPGTSAIDAFRDPAPGDEVGFDFATGQSGGIAAGTSSERLFITTNAIHFDNNGESNVIDGNTASQNSYQPTATPEASTVVPFVFVGLGLLGLAGARRKKAHATFA